jgi:hypothetical protein
MRTILFLLIISIVGCSSGRNPAEQRNESVVVAPQTSTITYTPVPLLTRTETERSTVTPVPKNTELLDNERTCQSEMRRLDRVRISRFWWISNSSEIGFLTETGDIGVYHLQDQSSSLEEVSFPAEIEIPKDLLQGIPEPFEENNLLMSPTETKAIYLAAMATETGEPVQGEPNEVNELGEPNISQISTDVYWLDRSTGSPIRIGRVEGTVRVIWSSDETKVGLISTIPSGLFGPVSVWIYDHTASELLGLFDTPQDNFLPLSFTPDGEAILFRRGVEVRTINLDHKKEMVLPVQPFQYFWWKSDVQLIALVPAERQHYKVIMYDFTDNSIQYLSTIEINPIPFVIGAVDLSPDQSTIAFISNTGRSLSIVNLCY